MYELLLYGQVPVGRHEQVLKILAGVAAMQPLRILERCIIYKPQREPEEPGLNVRRGGTQNIALKQGNKPATAAAALYYTKLIQKLSEDDFGVEHGKPLSADVKDGEEAKWSMRWEDQPDTGDRGVSIRFTNTTDLLSGDPHAHMIATGPNRFVTEYYVEGHGFVHGNVIIFLHRVLHEPGVRSLEVAPKTQLPDFAALQLLDMSGAYILEVKLRVQDFKDAATLESGVNELKGFQKQMAGCVELSLPDRLSLDTRVKYKPPHAGAAPAQNRPR
ncbi:mediator of RNA polymerase II transcription subunit 18 [Parastagonospora nodorum]|nr:mediator of RNA polymerase II transcription subunit 18 [Parastagonospora nodorum]KAH4037462.1 mediator of RNA polymerase II transcription subunit 18 [Parastagonospora nodorum]KAH4108040.1 mediator of RNA polymerase II transcription subunit 18 [Parastagonospora nodorum]KAH4119602.1 mediator of RNA polymerase II transcription subunit 18 [Parastagonospora nodorum]KAH4195688.1 mediator of RNA polymerase II transcription subunit 18 [Parastagonospora nodorum]